MGKIYVDSVKYLIHARIVVDGIVEKPDVIGAIFGQTEGLLGDELEMRELQKTGRIGRIEANLEHRNGKTYGHIVVPSGLGLPETAIIAAALETVDRVGPYEAKITVERIEDTREMKRRYLINRAKELLRKVMREEIPDSKELIEKIKSELRMHEIVEYGPERLPAGPAIDEAEEIIVVEGRADVLNLLKYGIRNVIAINGTKIPRTIVELSKRKTTTLFVDGDRGGDMIIREALQKADIDYVAKAPDGKEVEELTQKEILKALRRRIPAEEYAKHHGIEKTEVVEEERPRRRRKEKAEEKKEPEVPKEYMDVLTDLRGTLKARLLDEKGEVLAEIPVREVWSKLKEIEGVHAIVMDGVVTQRLVDAASSKGVKVIVGVKKTDVKVPEGLEVYA